MCNKQEFKNIILKFLDENIITQSSFDEIIIKYNNNNFRAEDLGRNIDITYHDILACIHTMEEFNKKSPLITEMAKMLYEAIDDEIQSLKDIQTCFKYEYLGRNYEPSQDKGGK